MFAGKSQANGLVLLESIRTDAERRLFGGRFLDRAEPVRVGIVDSKGNCYPPCFGALLRKGQRVRVIGARDKRSLTVNQGGKFAEAAQHVIQRREDVGV